MHEKDPSVWQSSHELIVNPDLVYLFLKDYQNGIIAMDGSQPWLPDVLSGAKTFQFQRRQPSRGHFRAGYALKMKSALSRLEATQYDLRMVPLGPRKIGNDSTIQHLIKNLIMDTPREAKL